MSKKSMFALIATFLFLSSRAQDSSMVRRLQALMPAYEKLNQFSGTVLLGYKGNSIFEHYYGLADREKNTMNSSNSLYNIGSIGKMFTSVAILQLVEKGKLKLEEPIQKYLQEYKLPNADKITTVHLLTHTSGYNTYMRSKDYDNSRVYSLDELVKLIATQPLKFETPGAGSAYSNSAFVILGRLIEKTSGMNWWDYYVVNIFKPASITNVYRLTPGQSALNKAIGYSYNAAGTYENVTSDPMPYSDGGLYATAKDLLKFIAALQSGKLVSKKMYEMMTKKYSDFDAFKCKMGLGWEISTVGNKELIAKGGNVQGFSGQMVILPEGYSLILLSNLSTGAFDNFNDIILAMYGLKEVQPKMASTNFIYEQIKQQGWEKIKPRMKDVEEQNGYVYNFQDYVRVGMTLKEQKDYETAAAIMEEIMKDNNEYVFGYELLGQTYELLNEKQKAVDNYRKVISLDPSIDHVVEKIKKLEKGETEKAMK